MSKSLAVAAQGVRLVNVPDNATPELIWVTARAVCSAFGAVLFKGDTVDFPNQFAQSIADARARSWRAGGHFWSATMGFDRSQQRGPGARRLRPDEPDPRAVMELLVGGQDDLRFGDREGCAQHVRPRVPARSPRSRSRPLPDLFVGGRWARRRTKSMGCRPFPVGRGTNPCPGPLSRPAQWRAAGLSAPPSGTV